MDVPAVTSVPMGASFSPAAASGSPPSFSGIKPEPAGDTALVSPIAYKRTHYCSTMVFEAELGEIERSQKPRLHACSKLSCLQTSKP